MWYVDSIRFVMNVYVRISIQQMWSVSTYVRGVCNYMLRNNGLISYVLTQIYKENLWDSRYVQQISYELAGLYLLYFTTLFTHRFIHLHTAFFTVRYFSDVLVITHNARTQIYWKAISFVELIILQNTSSNQWKQLDGWNFQFLTNVIIWMFDWGDVEIYITYGS